MYSRWTQQRVEESLTDSRVVLLHGPRQSGKSTIVRAIAEKRAWRYITFDHAAAFSAAQSDPSQFITQLETPVALDEVQRVPELFRAIKQSVDSKPAPGRFLLTGSANALMVPTRSDSLAGRMEILNLWPLSQGEIAGKRETFLDIVFSKDSLPWNRAIPTANIIDRLLCGGFPEVQERNDFSRQQMWFESYLITILQRDVRDLARVDDIGSMPRLMECLASRAGGLLNFADVARTVSLPQTTLKRYFSLLEATFLIIRLPHWAVNRGKRMARAAKVHLVDTGLAATLLRLDKERLLKDRMAMGSLFESFVVMEIMKQSSWHSARPGLFHFRTDAGSEVDLVLEGRNGDIVGIEIKSGSSGNSLDFSGLQSLAEHAKDRFVRGIIIYTGNEPLPFGEKFHALPVGCLWE